MYLIDYQRQFGAYTEGCRELSKLLCLHQALRQASNVLGPKGSSFLGSVLDMAQTPRSFPHCMAQWRTQGLLSLNNFSFSPTGTPSFKDQMSVTCFSVNSIGRGKKKKKVSMAGCSKQQGAVICTHCVVNRAGVTNSHVRKHKLKTGCSVKVQVAIK